MLTALATIVLTAFVTIWGLKMLWAAEARAATDPFLRSFVQWLFVAFYMVVLGGLSAGLILLGKA